MDVNHATKLRSLRRMRRNRVTKLELFDLAMRIWLLFVTRLAFEVVEVCLQSMELVLWVVPILDTDDTCACFSVDSTEVEHATKEAVDHRLVGCRVIVPVILPAEHLIPRLGQP